MWELELLTVLCQSSKVSYAVCGVISIRDLEHGDIVVFGISQSAVCMSEAQEQHQAAHTASHD